MGVVCTRSEMDIMPVFGTVVGGSNPSGCTKNKESEAELLTTMFFASRRDSKSADATASSWGRGNFQQKIICDRISF